MGAADAMLTPHGSADPAGGSARRGRPASVAQLGSGAALKCTCGEGIQYSRNVLYAKALMTGSATNCHEKAQGLAETLCKRLHISGGNSSIGHAHERLKDWKRTAPPTAFDDSHMLDEIT